MKDCSLKICLNCENCKVIQLNRKGWWSPLNISFNMATFGEPFKTCFLGCKGQEYGPTEHCVFKFEHTVLDNRKNFKLNTFEDFIEVYEYIQENKLSFIQSGDYSFSIRKDVNFDPSYNFYTFKMFLFSTEAYKNGNFGKVLLDMEERKFIKSFTKINESKSAWLDRFAKKRTGNTEEKPKERKHRIVFPVAGVTFENRQEKIEKLANIFNSGKRMEVEFEPEPENSYDKNAVKVLVLNNGNKEFVGYVPQTLNKDQDNESKIENFNKMISDIINNIERAETSWIGEKNGNYGIRVVCYEKN